MRVLHIASLTNRKDSGVSVAVPQYFINEKKVNPETYLLNVKTSKIPLLEKQSRYGKMRDYKQISSFINDIKPQIVVFHEVYYPIFIPISKLLKDKKIPYIIVPHGCLTKNAQKHKKAKKILGNLLFRKYIKNSSAIHYLSRMEAEKTIIRNKKYFIIGNGIKIPKSNPHTRGNKKYLLYIGRINFYHKGIDLLLEAVALVKDHLIKNKIKIRIYGTTEEKTQIKINRIIKENQLIGVIELYRPIFGKEKEKVINSCYAFIQTSRFEGLPMGLIEAMAHGAPIIATAGTGLAEEINNSLCGIGCTTKAADVAKSILQFIDEDEDDNYSRNSFSYANNNYAWGNITKMNIKQYKRIIRGDNDF